MPKSTDFTLPLNFIIGSFDAMLHTRQLEIDTFVRSCASAIASDAGEQILTHLTATMTDEIAKKFAEYFTAGAGRNVIESSVQSTLRRFSPAIDLIEENNGDDDGISILYQREKSNEPTTTKR